jgi:hypothetical protein
MKASKFKTCFLLGILFTTNKYQEMYLLIYLLVYLLTYLLIYPM